jgi:IS5 family transposase
MNNFPGLFDYENRMEKLSQTRSGLDRLNSLMDWEMFRGDLEEAVKKESKGPGGRPRLDVVLMFKVLVLQRLYNLSDEQMEYQINDRLSFQKFLGITLSDPAPDQKTIWLFREDMGRNGGVEKLFSRFDRHLSEQGIMGREGKIVDASFVEVPRQRNSREDNQTIKSGGVPDSFAKNKHCLRQKDVDARWTKKNEEPYYGYKNHLKADQRTKLIAKYEVTDASVHDSQALESLVEAGDKVLYADSAYRSEKISSLLEAKGIANRIHEKGYRNHPLTEEQKASNTEKSRVRARVEHVFGQMTHAMNEGLYLQYIGLKRIIAGVGLLNLTYNMIRYEQIRRLALI